MKKRLNLLIMMLLPMVAVNALAQLVAIGNITYSLSEETAKVVSCSEFGNGAIEIPSTVSYEGKDYSVTTIGGFAFFRCTKLKSIVIPNGVTTIEGRAFEGCTGLTTLTIPNSVTTIEAQAFYYCSSLASITIPQSVTTIGEGVFYSCSGLTSITVEEGNPQFDSRYETLLLRHRLMN